VGYSLNGKGPSLFLLLDQRRSVAAAAVDVCHSPPSHRSSPVLVCNPPPPWEWGLHGPLCVVPSALVCGEYPPSFATPPLSVSSWGQSYGGPQRRGSEPHRPACARRAPPQHPTITSPHHSTHSKQSMPDEMQADPVCPLAARAREPTPPPIRHLDGVKMEG